jgi:subtilisin-like proprotein convertase family protein
MLAVLAAAMGVLAGTGSASAASFSGVNTTPIVTPAAINATTATPYPSSIPVSGVAGTVSGAQVSLHSFTDTFTPDVQIVLVAPSGKALLLMNAVGSNGTVTNLELTFSDQASDHAPAVSVLTAGTYKPTNWEGTNPPDFPSPGPGQSWANPGPAGGGSATFASALGGDSPNGNWNLFVQDRSTSNGTIGGGWSLSLTTIEPTPATPKTKCKKHKKRRSAQSAKKKCKKKR